MVINYYLNPHVIFHVFYIKNTLKIHKKNIFKNKIFYNIYICINLIVMNVSIRQI
jgi:hypothetical protein